MYWTVGDINLLLFHVLKAPCILEVVNLLNAIITFTFYPAQFSVNWWLYANIFVIRVFFTSITHLFTTLSTHTHCVFMTLSFDVIFYQALLTRYVRYVDMLTRYLQCLFRDVWFSLFAFGRQMFYYLQKKSRCKKKTVRSLV